MPDATLEFLRREPGLGATVKDGLLHAPGYGQIELTPAFSDPHAKLAELRANQIDGAVISANPPLFFYGAPAAIGEALCRVTNGGMAEMCAQGRGHLFWMAHLPLQDVERAVLVLADAAAAGCVGVEVGTIIAGHRLDEPVFEPFWSRVEALDLTVFIHPGDNPPYPGLQDFFLRNVIGHQLETTIAIERLICVGILDRHPGLRVLLPHGGGYFPIQAGRLAHARKVRPELAVLKRDPRAYAGQIFVDTLTHDDDGLEYLARKMGPGHVVLGTDMPTMMASPEPINTLRKVLGEATALVVAADNPVRLFKLGGRRAGASAVAAGRAS